MRTPFSTEQMVALISGSPKPSLRQIFNFTSAVKMSHRNGVKVRWPPCYIACVQNIFKGQGGSLNILRNSLNLLDQIV